MLVLWREERLHTNASNPKNWVSLLPQGHTSFYLGIDGHSFAKERMAPSQPSHSYFQDTSWLFRKWKFAIGALHSQTNTEKQAVVHAGRTTWIQWWLCAPLYLFHNEQHGQSARSTRTPRTAQKPGIPETSGASCFGFFWCRERHPPFLSQSLQPGQDLWDYGCACKVNVARAT